MTIRQVAQAAGVSTATVSRVLNSAPYIAEETAQAVRRAMAEVQYDPNRRRRSSKKSAQTQELKVGFYVMELNPTGQNPAYERLLRGVADAAQEYKLDLKFGFIRTAEQNAVEQLRAGNFDGLILHGLPPNDEESRPIRDIPTVWLLGGRQRPGWGDQIMPDNDSIGRIAAGYLLGQGHRDVMYFAYESAWFYKVRVSAFQSAIEDAGGQVLSTVRIPSRGDVLRDAAAGYFLEAWNALPKKPTGLFVAEDWLLAPIYAAAAKAGIRIGSDLQVVSCNNDRVRLEGLDPQPATIDVHFDRAAYRGVQLLNYRLTSKSFDDRARILLEPTLVLP